MNNDVETLPYSYPLAEHNVFYSTLSHKNIYIENSWILIPTRLVNLINDFILFKQSYGTKIEQKFYKAIDTPKMIKRMFKNRPLGFMNSSDYYVLQDGTDGMGHWESIGSNKESEPLLLTRYMSYDELELSSFLSISIFTPFINKGSRKNWGKREENCQPNGIYIGQVGPRFQKQFRMEWRFMIVEPEQNIPENGYGPQPVQGKNSTYLSLWANFYDIDYFPLYLDVEKDTTGRYFKLNNGPYLDILVYKKRIRYSAELFLKEANYRAMKIGKQAFCHVVGLGLGVWKIAEIQTILTIEVYLELLVAFKFPFISDLYFAWFNITEKEIQFPTEINGVNIHKGIRDPAEPLNDSNKLLVANWAWDSNSYIGNEYWCGNLGSSGDPAAASCSFIAYIGNPDLNDINEVHHF